MDAIDFDFDDDDNLSTALGTETLAVRDMVPEGFDNTPRARGSPEQTTQGKRYLVVEQSANKRHQSKISKIWQYGIELRALDTPRLDTIEALECLKAWFDKGFINEEENVH
jgi:hypothetical protein